MEVILIQPVKKTGTIGSIINVKPGFARNYLIPQKIAIRATKANRELIKEKTVQLEEQNKELLIEAQNSVINVADKEITFIQACADDGRLFGSVTRKDIARVFETTHNYKISINKIVLESPIKNVGFYVVEVALHPDVLTSILINVARSETEAQNALKAHKDAKAAPSDTSEENKSSSKSSDTLEENK